MRFCLGLIVFLSFVASVQFGARAHDANLRIGAWNVEADRVSSGVRIIPERRIPRIAEVIAAMNPDVLAVSEIAPHTRIKDIREHLALAGLCYKSKLVSQPAQLNVGFFYKCNIEATNARLVPKSGYGPTDKRKALAVDFKAGKFDFTAISVHFKSSGGSANQALRDEQVGAVWDYVKTEILPDQDDVLIMGDYNMTPMRDPENFETLNPDNYFRFVTSEELEARDGFTKIFSHISNSGNGAGNLLDGMAIGRTATSEYVVKSIKVVPMDLFVAARNLQDFARRYSDHLPLMAEFRNVDDD